MKERGRVFVREGEAGRPTDMQRQREGGREDDDDDDEEEKTNATAP